MHVDSYHILLALLVSFVPTYVYSFIFHPHAQPPLVLTRLAGTATTTTTTGIGAAIETFERTLASRNIAAKGTKHVEFEWGCGNVRGLQATIPFRRGSAVVQLPVAQSISAPDALGTAKGCPAGMEDVWIDSSVTVRVSLQLLKEWQSMSGSAKPGFGAYIDALPPPGTFGTPLHWPAAVMDTFPYKHLVDEVTKQNNRLLELYQKISKSKAFQGQGISFERFVWSVEVVGSRAFKGIGISSSSFPLYGAASAVLVGAAAVLSSMNGIGEIIPIVLALAGMIAPLPAVLQSTQTSCVLLQAIDSSNHQGTGAVCDIALDPTRNAFVMQANQDIDIGQEITISYGEKHNDDLLIYFGFVEERCAFDRYVLRDPVVALEAALNGVSGTGSEGAASSAHIEELRRRLSSRQGGQPGQPPKGDQKGPQKVSPNFIATRADGVTVQSLGDLSCLLDKTNSLDAVAKAGLRLLLNHEKKTIDAAVTGDNKCLEGFQSETERCVAKKFLTEKIGVLEVALGKL